MIFSSIYSCFLRIKRTSKFSYELSDFLLVKVFISVVIIIGMCMDFTGSHASLPNLHGPSAMVSEHDHGSHSQSYDFSTGILSVSSDEVSVSELGQIRKSNSVDS